MSLELLNTLAAVGTFLVIAATALAAAKQLRHLRWNNQLQAVLALRSERNAELEDAFHFISAELPMRLEDPHYRADLETALAPSRRVHKELLVADYFEHVGTYVKEHLIEEDVYFQISSPARYWQVLAPVIAIYQAQSRIRCLREL